MGLIFNRKKLCNHKWKKEEFVRSYRDYSGFRVGVFRCKCKKCGLVEIRKYYRFATKTCTVMKQYVDF